MGQIEPGDRTEMLLAGILNGDTETNIEPGDREEMLLAGILRGDTESNIEPGSRKEALLKAILEKGTGPKLGDVNYIDFDGTIIKTYTAEEYADLAEHPLNTNTHAGLEFTGWSMTLSAAKSWVETYGGVVITAKYQAEPNS